MSDELPKSWVNAPLDSLCQKFRGVSYGRDDASIIPKKGYVPILRANNLQNDRLIFDDLVWVPEQCVSDQQKLRMGDIVIAMSSGSKSVVGKTAQVMEDWQGSFGAFCGALRPWSELNSRYVGLFLRTREYRNTISELAAGSNINNLKNEHLAAIEVPVAPLAEQRRIVAKLEKLLGQVDACRQRLEKLPTLLKRFRQSILAAACSGRLTADWREEHDLDDEWPVEPLSEFFEMRNGKSLVATKRQEGEIPVYGGNGLMGAHNAANAEGLVIVIGRVGAQCGNVHYVTGKVWVTDNAISLQGKKELVPAFYAFFLRSLNLNTMSAGTGQPYVSQEILGPIETPLVSLAEQQQIVRRVAGLFALADQLEQRLAQARKQVDKLMPSLLARAFAGQLVPQNPNDEPAAKLLERIHNR